METVGVSKMLVKHKGVPSVPRRQIGWVEAELHSFQTLEAERNEWLTSCFCCFTHRGKKKHPAPIENWAGWAQEVAWKIWNRGKSLVPTRIEPQVIQATA